MPKCAPIQSLDVGEIQLTWIPDGIHHVRALEQYRGGTPELWNIHSQYIDADDWLVMSIGALLVRIPNKNVLIDLGFGPRSVEDIGALAGNGHKGDLSGGELLNNLRQVGVTPADIDGIVISHLHPDHIGWASVLMEDAARTAIFPNAEYFIGATEWNYWLNGPEAGTPRAPTADELEIMQRRLTLLEGTKTPFFGMTAMPTPGHTPGHLSFVISSGEARAVVLGDAIHCPAEITQPELDFVFDVDPEFNRRTKEMIVRELESPHTHMVGGHFPDAVFGRLLQGSVTRRIFA